MQTASAPRPRAMAMAMALALACTLAWAHSPEPQEPAGTPAEAAVWSDLRAYRAQQSVIQALLGSGPQNASYSLAKAQCWLDVSFHEYTHNDGSSFPLMAFEESIRITRFLASGGLAGTAYDPAYTTFMINDAARLRPDLWQRLHALDSHSCAQRLKACGEVELVHAGHEFNQQGWLHARPYIQIAEDTVARAEAAAKQCPPRPVAVAGLSPAAYAGRRPSTGGAGASDRLVLGAAHFAFDRRTQSGILPDGRQALAALAKRLELSYASVQRIDVIGHADRLGGAAYNEQLSLERAQTVAAYLRSLGVTAPIHAHGQGASQPVSQCQGDRPTAALTACLQPDRRVEIEVHGVKR